MLQFELVVPAYNEAKNLPLLVERAARAAAGAGLTPERFRFVVVENGSTDDSAAVLAGLAAGPDGAWLRVVTVPKNQGYGYGLKAGLATTTATYVAWSHADLQCDPRDAIAALQASEAEVDLLVKGRRRRRNWKDWVVSRVFELLAAALLGLWVFDLNAQPKAFPRKLLRRLEQAPDSFGFDLYALYQAKRLGLRFRTIPVDFPPRLHGLSNWASTLASRRRTILGMVRLMVTLARSEGRL